MEGTLGSEFIRESVTRRKRSRFLRRPRSLPFGDFQDISTSLTPSENTSRILKDESTGHCSVARRKEFNLNDLNSRFSSVNHGNEKGKHKSELKRHSEGVLAPANWKSTNKTKTNNEIYSGKQDNHPNHRRNDNCHSTQSGISKGSENTLCKLKLKLGGVTHTLHTKSSTDGSEQGNKDVPNRDEITQSRDQPNNFPRENSKLKMLEETEPVRKSKRIPKRRFMDGDFEDGEEDDEIQYLEKLRNSKEKAYCINENVEEDSKKNRNVKSSKRWLEDEEYDNDDRYGSLRTSRESSRLPRSERESEDTDYNEEDDPGSDDLGDVKKTKQRKDATDSSTDGKKEISLTTRQRALQSSKDSPATTNLIEFPNGLPPAPPRKQKEKLSEVEQQLKKAEAAQRRRMLIEKAARESEAEAIRKILGQDSNRKKREDKKRKQQDELAQEKAAYAKMLAANSVRWVLGPTGTTVIFPDNIDLQNIFGTKPCSYPPPREKCAGPTCSNPYKYRDSKSNLPLCSLQCYRAVQDLSTPMATSF